MKGERNLIEKLAIALAVAAIFALMATPFAYGKPLQGDYPPNQCTWWARHRAIQTGWNLPWFPGSSGDAENWDDTAERPEYGLQTGTIPRGGAIAVWEHCTDAIRHVAFVEEVYENGTFRVSEQNWPLGSGPRSDRILSPASCMRFIYPPHPIVYEHAEYAGHWSHVKEKIADLYNLDFSYPETGVKMGDKISSIWVPFMWSVALYKHKSYECPGWERIDGPHGDFANDHFSDGSLANDDVSSIIPAEGACIIPRCAGSMGASSVSGGPISADVWSTGDVGAQSTGGICGGGQQNPSPPPDPPSQPSTDWQVSYYNNEGLSGSPVWSGTDGSGGVSHNWGTGSPASGVNADHWSARWEREVYFSEPGDWQFTIRSDDGFRLFIDGELFAHEWSSGWHDISPTKNSFSAGNHGLRFEYFDSTGSAQISLSWKKTFQEGSYHGSWYTEWFNWVDLDPTKLVSTSWEDQINYNWGTSSPGHGLGSDHFSVRWTGTFNFPTSGFYKFPIKSDDGFKLWVDGQLVGQEWWWEGGEHEIQPDRYLSAGNHEVKFEYFENEGHAKAQLSWWKFPDDTTSPTGQVIQPTDESAVSADQVKICAELDDGDGIGIDNVQIHLYHLAQPESWQMVGADYDGRDGWCATWNHSSWPDEEINTHLFVYDRAGNMFSGGGNTFQIDRTAPTGSFTSPTANAEITDDVVHVAVNANDNPSGVDRIEFQAYYDAGNSNLGWWPLGTDFEGGDGWSFEWNVSGIPSQEITILATIVDKAGNTASASASFQLTEGSSQDSVQITKVWVADACTSSSQERTQFSPGETPVLKIRAENLEDSHIDTQWSWLVKHPDGSTENVHTDFPVSMRPGTNTWCSDPYSIPNTPGVYTFTGRVTWGGDGQYQDEKSTTFEVVADGPPPNNPGLALSFDGTDDYVDIGDRNSLESLSGMTVEAWIRLSGSSDDRAIISKYRHNSDNNLDDTFYLGVLNGTGRWQLNSGDSYSVVNGHIRVDDGFWHHIAGTWDGSTMRLYVDGILDASVAYAGSGQTNDTNVPITVGRSMNVGAPAWFLDGQVDDLRVWNAARSQTEIQTFMNRSLSGNEVGLLAYWDLDGGSGQIAYDATDNHNDGQLGSIPTNDGNDPVWIVSHAPIYGTAPTSTPVWKALLLVYHNIDVDYTDNNGDPQHLTTTMPEHEILKGLWAFRQYASIAHDFSEGQAIIQYDVVHVSRSITSLTSMGDSYWVSPADSRQELDQYAPPGTYDSILVYWPQTDFSTGQQIPSFGWGWGMGPSSWSNGATYATVANAPDWMWERLTVGEPWLHEWLHGVCDYYSDQDYTMPTGGPDGASSHGYTWSSTTGWGDYDRDLMTGHVLENSTYTGISADAWQSGTILGYKANVAADYFCASTINAYQRSGTVVWQSDQHNIPLGDSTPADNWMYAPVNLNHDFTVVGRAYIPSSGVGAYDTVAIALRNNQVEYWATLAYGTNLVERNHISIMRNGSWGTLVPFTLNPGWYTVKVMVDYQNEVIRMKAWADGDNEPDWQTSRTLDLGWVVDDVGFRHYGQGTLVDDLFVIGAGGGGENKVFLPIILR